MTTTVPVHLVVLSFTSFLLLPVSHSADVKYCGAKEDYAVKVQGVKILPDPVVRGQAATFNISATTGQAISGGKVVIEVYYFGVRVHTETHDLCEELSCPVSAGNFVLSHTQTLPGITPPGSYNLRMTIQDNHNHKLSCISFNFKIIFGSLVYAS
ncbi:PREDICTED: putative phosphatidylglycerol/phosphatidylinositol transfer protein DDB_G0282179 [Fragaria vesca subsp. vesca]|uniref:putative phosphatidylglycerol/phosphatidylinositol transfer protein DDB_G0282179 n=1 Tax=Fragaria vesca subsp. vesca TaxID=101020 RepID=UPI0002C326F8|nr:PREDICTED: putative phosphatidylglycerol/phosphatidylinositol transfer protein DDB_G0282179 [Fragaria vesca subsp. vesca]